MNAVNTGNAFCIRLGHRDGKQVGRVNNVSLRNFDVQIPAGSPDAGYPFQGPPNSEPENIEPAVIIGLPGNAIKDVTLDNIHIRVAGGISARVPKRTRDDLAKIPERPSDYPEFSMLGELPSWALYVRHAEGLKIHDFQVTLDGPDYRPPFVFDDVHGLEMEDASVKGTAAKPEVIVRNVSGTKFPSGLTVSNVAR